MNCSLSCLPICLSVPLGMYWLFFASDGLSLTPELDYVEMEARRAPGDG